MVTTGAGNERTPVGGPVDAIKLIVTGSFGLSVLLSVSSALSVCSAVDTDTMDTTRPVTGPLPITTIILPDRSDTSMH